MAVSRLYSGLPRCWWLPASTVATNTVGGCPFSHGRCGVQLVLRAVAVCFQSSLRWLMRKSAIWHSSAHLQVSMGALGASDAQSRICYDVDAKGSPDARFVFLTCTHRFHRSCLAGYKVFLGRTHTDASFQCPKCRTPNLDATATIARIAQSLTLSWHQSSNRPKYIFRCAII